MLLQQTAEITSAGGGRHRPPFGRKMLRWRYGRVAQETADFVIALTHNQSEDPDGVRPISIGTADKWRRRIYGCICDALAL